MKKISLIMPVYNTADYLDISIGSVLDQTMALADIGIILIDDHSDDGETVEKLKEFESRFPDNTTIILNERNMGPGGCRNIALKYASGEYTFFLDSDDRIEKDTFEYLYRAAKEYDADVVEFGYCRENSHDTEMQSKFGRELKVLQSNTIDSEEKRRAFVLPSDSEVICWDKLYRTDMLKKNGICFAEGISYEEPPFSYMVRFFCERYIKVKGDFYHYFKRPGSSSDIENYKKNRFHIVEGYLKLYEEATKHGFDISYKDEIEYIFWCGAFYLPLFNMAAAGTFYSEEEFYILQNKVRTVVPEIMSNPYFKKDFNGLEIIGKLTYIPEKSVPFEDIVELFQKLAV